jgi:predicted CXXCH cytochrome family protein
MSVRRWAGLLCGSAILGTVAVVLSGQPQREVEAKVIFPPTRSVLLSGSIHVIARAVEGELKVDGQPQPWEAFASPLRVAKLGLASGMHDVQIGKRKLRFVVGASAEEHEGPKDWQVWHFHPIKTDAKRCEACHETSQSDGKTAVGAVKPSKCCYDCHRPVDVEAKHAHPMKSLEDCQSCHALHGSNRKSSLKAPVKQLCSECHES